MKMTTDEEILKEVIAELFNQSMRKRKEFVKKYGTYDNARTMLLR